MPLPLLPLFARVVATVAAASTGQKLTGSVSVALSLGGVVYAMWGNGQDTPKKTWKREWSPGSTRSGLGDPAHPK